MHRNPFSDAELDRRLETVRREIEARRLDAIILSTPENIFYLTGLDHWGWFAPHMLVVPLDRRPVLVTRAMERVAVADMVRNAEFRGHSDAQAAADVAATVLGDMGLSGRRIGIEAWSAGLSHGQARALEALVEADWADISDVMNPIRQVKSEEEQALMRRAATVTDAGTAAAIAAIGAGASEREVAAECLAAMTRSGGDPPGFGPFIRPEARLGQEHATWGDGRYRDGETVFLELAGCVGRYHAPNGRLVHLGPMPAEDRAIAEVAIAAYRAVLDALRPGARAREVYAAWQAVVDAAGLSHYRRHHCGYSIGIGIPPSWTGGSAVTGLRHDSDLEIRAGMSFHVLSWLIGTGRGNFFLSDCVLVGAAGPEVLTSTPHLPPPG